MLRVVANRREGYELLHNGAIELAVVEGNGIRIDVPKLADTEVYLKDCIRDLRTELGKGEEWEMWRKRYGSKANISSRDQLASIVYEDLGFEVQDWTESGKPSTDEEALQKFEHPFITRLVRLTKYEKAFGTYLKGIRRELVGDRIHPVFNLHIVRTYRSSSDSPNFQNYPVRDKEISEIIRSLFIASPGCVLVENDFKGIEVAVAGCYHRDPNFISYITTPGKDMHRDMAAQLYMMEPKEVSKEARYGAKNKFVFPEFYGDFYASCARALWDWIEKGKLKGPGDVPLFDHLKQQGIQRLGACDPELKPVKGTFEHHVKEVEDDFWNNRFMIYGKWRKEWYGSYLERGYFDTFTGFRVFGSFSRNASVNYPVQGSAFHCLLWTLIEVNRALRKYGLRSKVVGQIHDSLIGDVRIDELRDYLSIVEEVVTVHLRKRYDWIIVPLEVEYEIAPEDGSWFDKREVKFKQGRFLHPEDPRKSTTDARQFVRSLGKT
jgi:DNA polymerase-1